MRVLVIGSGGREHALVHALASSPSVTAVFCSPGNAGIRQEAELVPLGVGDSEGLLAFAVRERIDLTVVGPEQPLVDGIVDLFRANGLRVFGPTAAAARLEGSKVFSKQFMERFRIPTARFGAFTKANESGADAFIHSLSVPMVVKADGLAAGKGVLICASHDEAVEQLHAMLSGISFGAAGSSVVVEEFLEGEEASVFVLTDGLRYGILPAAQDHKRIFDNDEGKNTGGMGAYAPAPIMTPPLLRQVEEEIIRPTLDGMRSEGNPYTGCLYVGLMITPQGPKVLEYNCRFGDPETQVVLPLLDSDAGKLFGDIASGSFSPDQLRVKDKSAACVVMVSEGYPDAYVKGKVVSGLASVARMENVCVFHAGTKNAGEDIVTSGGRVLGVTAIGPIDDLARTIRNAYDGVRAVTFEGAHFRSDIGAKALRRSTTQRLR